MGILICGEPRSIDLVIDNITSIFSQTFDISLYICTNYKYVPETHVKKTLILNDQHDNEFRNALNYSFKLHHGIPLFNDECDLYLIIRSDSIIEKWSFDINSIDPDALYFPKVHMNQFTSFTNDRINDSIILTKNPNLLSGLYKSMTKDTTFLDIGIYKYIQENKIKYYLMDIQYKLILYKCNVIAISGDSGSGKTTMMKCMRPLLGEKDTLLLETDRYHKWERGNKNYDKYTHLNPYANNVEKMCEDVYNLKIGNEIYQVDYDHDTGRFTGKEKIESKQNIIICGLHTLYDTQMNKILDLKIFMDTDRELMKSWKIQRDVIERGYTMEKVMNQILFRESDYEKYIASQKEAADILVQFDENTEDNTIQGNLLIKNHEMSSRILKFIVKYSYVTVYIDNCLQVKLKGDVDYVIDDPILSDILCKNESIYKNSFYKEIFILLYKIIM